jgi:hypothetical protein
MAQALRSVQEVARTPTRKRAVRARIVNKSECRHFGWTRHQFDQKVLEGMPVVEAAHHKGGEWRLNLTAVSRWVRGVEEEAERRRLCRDRQVSRLAGLAECGELGPCTVP